VLSKYRGRAPKRGLVWELTDEQFIVLVSDSCHYCGASPDSVIRPWRKSGVPFLYNGIDRKDNDVGYTTVNVVTCCKTCNFAKRNLTYREFVAYLHRIQAFGELPSL